MPRKCVCVALVTVFALAASPSGHAQVTVDVTKVNCDQFVHHKISEPRLIAAWLSGYYNQQLLRPDAEIVDGEVSFEPPSHHSITSSASASSLSRHLRRRVEIIQSFL